MYNIYTLFYISKYELMMVVYNPINDVLNKFDLGIEKYSILWKDIIDGCLLLVQVCNVEKYSHKINSSQFLKSSLKIDC